MQRQVLATIILSITAAGCLLLPIPESNPKVVEGSRIQDTATSLIKPGITTRAQVIQKLGEPNLDMPELHLIAYSWAQTDYNLYWVAAGSAPPGIAGGELPMPQPHVFFVAFDQEERVLAFGVAKKGSRLIQEAARDWEQQEGLAVPPLPSGFVAHDVPSGQSVLYIYR